MQRPHECQDVADMRSESLSLKLVGPFFPETGGSKLSLQSHIEAQQLPVFQSGRQHHWGPLRYGAQAKCHLCDLVGTIAQRCNVSSREPCSRICIVGTKSTNQQRVKKYSGCEDHMIELPFRTQVSRDSNTSCSSKSPLLCMLSTLLHRCQRGLVWFVLFRTNSPFLLFYYKRGSTSRLRNRLTI